MNTRLLALVAALGLSSLPTLSRAQDSPLSFNLGAVTDYRYRGISQTRFKPALQGGLDYAFPTGFYVGAWASTIQWIKDNGVDGGVEL
ncbi:MAG: TorF family putative porin, partial [Burkholderiaceae bacterium]